MNVLPISDASHSEQKRLNRSVPGSDTSLSFLSGQKLNYATNLLRDWQAQLLHYNGLKPGSCKLHKDNVFRLLNHARVAPWELTKDHVTKFLAAHVDRETGETLAPATVGTYCAGWRSMQDFMLEPDRVNEILREFKVRAKLFITEENSIAVKRHKLNWVPKGWALSPEEIEAIDSTFIREIRRAKAEHSKALMPLQRDRVMFHIAIHFALRVSELVAVRVQDFRASDKEDLSHFGKRGVLTALGKNDVTGSVPMRDPSIHALLEWYMGSVREHMVMGRKAKEGDTGMCKSRGRDILVNDLMFISQQGGIIAGNTFRKRLADIAIKAGVLRQKLTPHTLRHTGCTLMVPLYSPEIAQKYMRHKHLHTTLYYYHPTPLQAGNEVNAATALFDDDEED